MGKCIPPGGCERRVIEPFIVYRNGLREISLVFRKCLDKKLERNKPQPELLYVDEKSGAHLAVEHKTLILPRQHAKFHSSDHALAHRIELSIFPQIGEGRSYELSLPYHIRATKKELSKFADSIVACIRTYWNRVDSGTVVGGRSPGRQWRFRRLHDWEFNDDEGPGGLRIAWPMQFGMGSLGPTILSEAKEDVARYLATCVQKFQDFPEATKVLLIECVGDIRLEDKHWKEMLGGLTVPPGIDEVWVAEEDWITHFEQGWEFKQVFPIAVVRDLFNS